MFKTRLPGWRWLASGAAAGMRVLDVCAAPGGKTFAAAIQMDNQGEVISCDLHPHKKSSFRPEPTGWAWTLSSL